MRLLCWLSLGLSVAMSMEVVQLYRECSELSNKIMTQLNILFVHKREGLARAVLDALELSPDTSHLMKEQSQIHYPYLDDFEKRLFSVQDSIINWSQHLSPEKGGMLRMHQDLLIPVYERLLEYGLDPNPVVESLKPSPISRIKKLVDFWGFSDHFQWKYHQRKNIKNQEWSAERNTFNRRINQLESKVRSLNHSKWTLQKKNDKLTKELSELKSELKDKQTPLDGLSERVQLIYGMKEQKEPKHQTRDKEFERRLQLMKEQTRMQIYQKELEHNEKLDSFRKEKESEIKNLNLQLDSQRLQSRDKANEISALRNRVNELETKLKESDQRRDETKEEMTAKDGLIQELEQRLRLMDQQRHSVMADLSSKDKRVSELEIKNEDLSEQLRSSEKPNGELSEKNSEMARMKGELTQMSVLLQNKEEEIKSLKLENVRMNGGLGSMRMKMEEGTQRASISVEQSDEIQRIMDAFSKERERVEIGELKNELTKRDSVIKEQQQQIEDQKQQIERVSGERARMKAELEEMKKRVSAEIGEAKERGLLEMDEYEERQALETDKHKNEVNNLKQQLSEKNELILGLEEKDDRGSIEMEESDHRLIMVEDMAKQVLSEREDLVRESDQLRSSEKRNGDLRGALTSLKGKIEGMQREKDQEILELRTQLSDLDVRMDRERSGNDQLVARLRNQITQLKSRVAEKDDQIAHYEQLSLRLMNQQTNGIHNAEEHARETQEQRDEINRLRDALLNLRSEKDESDRQRLKLEDENEQLRNALEESKRERVMTNEQDTRQLIQAEESDERARLMDEQRRMQLDESEKQRVQMTEKDQLILGLQREMDDRGSIEMEESENRLKMVEDMANQVLSERDDLVRELAGECENGKDKMREINCMREMVEKHQSEENELRSQLENSNEEINGLSEDNERMKNEVNDHKDEIREKNKVIQGLEQHLRSVQNENEQLRSDLKSADDQRARMSESQMESEQNILDLTQRIAELERGRDQSTVMLADKDGLIRQLRSQMDENEEQTTQSQLEIIQLRNEVAAKNDEMEQLRKQVMDQTQRTKQEREIDELNTQLIQEWQSQLDAALENVSELEREKQAAEEAVQCELTESEQRCEQIKREKKDGIHAIHDRLAEQTGIVAELQSRLATVESEKAIRRDQCAQSDGCSSLMQQHYEQSVLRKDEESEQAISERDRTVDALKQRLVDSEAERQERYSRLMREYNARVRSIDHYRVGTIALGSCNLLFIGVISVLLVRHRMHLRNHQMFRNRVLDLLNS